VEKVLKQIPLLNSVVNTEALEAFVDIDSSDEFYKTLEQGMQKKDANLLREKIAMKVKNVSSNEKIFQAKFPNGKMMYFKVQKNQNEFSIQESVDGKNYISGINVSNNNSGVIQQGSILNINSPTIINNAPEQPVQKTRDINVHFSAKSVW